MPVKEEKVSHCWEMRGCDDEMQEKEVCHFCTFFLTHGPSIEECPRQEHKLGARNRFIL